MKNISILLNEILFLNLRDIFYDRNGWKNINGQVNQSLSDKIWWLIINELNKPKNNSWFRWPSAITSGFKSQEMLKEIKRNI